MASLNRVLLIGNLTRDPEVRYTPTGTAVCDFGLAINRKYKEGNEWKTDVVFIDITAWAKTAELVGQYLKKGSSCFVDGRLQTDSWDDKQTGQKRTKLKVIAENVQFLDGKPEGQQSAPRQEKPKQQYQRPANAPEQYGQGDDSPPF